MENTLEITQSTHTLNAPVFVIGHARSGTSILTRLLRKYLMINFGTESQFLVRFYNRLDQYGDLSKDENARTLIDDISKERFFAKCRRNFNFDIDTNRVFNEAPERSYPVFVDTMFRHFSDFRKFPRWGDKTPEYINHLPIIHDMFPKAQYIHIVRDGRDVAMSIFRTHFGPKNFVIAAQEWRQQMLEAKSFFQEMPTEQYIEIHYEDLIQDPEPMLLKLRDFLQIDDSSGEVAGLINKEIHDDIKPGNFNKWKTQMTPTQRLNYERIAADMLHAYGYESWLDTPDELSSLETVKWRLHNMWARNTRLDYWQDNWYKAQLRSRELISTVRQKLKG